MSWIIIIAIIVIVVKNSDRIFGAINRKLEKDTQELQAKNEQAERDLAKSYQRLAEMEAQQVRPNINDEKNSPSTIPTNMSNDSPFAHAATNSPFSSSVNNSTLSKLNNKELCADLATAIVKYSNPFINYIKQRYPNTDESFYSFYPLMILAYFFDMFSLPNNRNFVFNVEKEVEKRATYTTVLKNSQSPSDSNILTMVWDNGIWQNYLDNKAQEDQKDKAIMLLFLRMIEVTAVDENTKGYDETMLKITGDVMRDFRKEATLIWDKYN